MKQVCDILIPVYNSPEWLEVCVEAAIISDRSDVIRQILLVDDCSKAETQRLIERLCEKYDKVISIRNEENLGFVKTCNRGMKLCSADYIMLLNSDCLLADNSTARMMNALQKNPQVGLICPLSNNAANLSVAIPDGANYVQMDKLFSELEDKVYPACTIVGNCMIITRACYDAVGGLDEAFGMGYGEETDYQFRAAAAGFDAIVAGNVYVFHKSQVSFGNSEKLSKQKQRNRELFFARWGNEYKRLMDEYVHNDPAKDAQQYLKHSSEKLLRKEITPFSEDFLARVRLVDGEVLNVAPVMSTYYDRIKAKYVELGFIGLSKLAVKRILAKAANLVKGRK